MVPDALPPPVNTKIGTGPRAKQQPMKYIEPTIVRYIGPKPLRQIAEEQDAFVRIFTVFTCDIVGQVEVQVVPLPEFLRRFLVRLEIGEIGYRLDAA